MTQPAPHQPLATPTKPLSSNRSTKSVKQNETKLCDKVSDKVVDILNDENHKITTDEVNIKNDATSSSDNTSNDKDAGNTDPLITSTAESTSSVGAAEDEQEATATVSQTTVMMMKDRSNLYKYFKQSSLIRVAANYKEVLDQQHKQFDVSKIHGHILNKYTN